MSIQNFDSSTSALEKKKVMGKINSAIRGSYSEFGGRMLDQIKEMLSTKLFKKWNWLCAFICAAFPV